MEARGAGTPPPGDDEWPSLAKSSGARGQDLSSLLGEGGFFGARRRLWTTKAQSEIKIQQPEPASPLSHKFPSIGVDIASPLATRGSQGWA